MKNGWKLEIPLESSGKPEYNFYFELPANKVKAEWGNKFWIKNSQGDIIAIKNINNHSYMSSFLPRKDFQWANISYAKALPSHKEEIYNLNVVNTVLIFPPPTPHNHLMESLFLI